MKVLKLEDLGLLHQRSTQVVNPFLSLAYDAAFVSELRVQRVRSLVVDEAAVVAI
jgi:hypothetical protein